MEKLDKKVAESIEWGGTRLICIASDFNRYDEYAVQQINRNVELMRYRYFGDNLLLLELVNAQTAETSTQKAGDNKPVPVSGSKNKSSDKSQEERLAESSPELISLYSKICDYASGLGDEVQRKEVKLYTAFKRIKNFLCIVVLPQNKDPRLQVYLKLDPTEIGTEEPYSRDVTNIGHWATGNLELNVRSESDLERTFALIQKSYQEN
jgi:predicted transport protein